MDKNPRWKGGRMKDMDGYVLIKMWDHPNARFNGYVAEHRLVMEAHIGRFLKPHEIVHHKNSNRSDNSIENLELLDGQAKHMTIERTGKKYPRKNRISVKCETCKSIFYRSHCYRDKLVRWCSWQCRYPNKH